MPSIKMKTHKGVKKRFKVTANGKVTHKRCGSSHLNSHKSGSKIRRLRKKSILKIGAEAQKLRRAFGKKEVITDPNLTSAGQPVVGAGIRPEAVIVAVIESAAAEPTEAPTA